MKAKPRPLDGERRQRLRIEADNEVRDGVAEAFCRGGGLCLGLRFLGERRRAGESQCTGRAEKQPPVDGIPDLRFLVPRSHVSLPSVR